MNEVEVLRFFEESPFEKAEVVFNIVSRKMRERRNQHAPKNKTAQTKASKRSGESVVTRDAESHQETTSHGA